MLKIIVVQVKNDGFFIRIFGQTSHFKSKNLLIRCLLRLFVDLTKVSYTFEKRTSSEWISSIQEVVINNSLFHVRTAQRKSTCLGLMQHQITLSWFAIEVMSFIAYPLDTDFEFQVVYSLYHFFYSLKHFFNRLIPFDLLHFMCVHSHVDLNLFHSM